jgi:hypothetical protein
MSIKTIAVSLNDIDNLDSLLPTVAGASPMPIRRMFQRGICGPVR